MSQYTDEEIKDSLERAPHLFAGVVAMYNRKLNSYKEYSKKKNIVIGAVCTGGGFGIAKLWPIAVKIIAILT